jgi:hypothetical protein
MQGCQKQSEDVFMKENETYLKHCYHLSNYPLLLKFRIIILGRLISSVFLIGTEYNAGLHIDMLCL